MEIKELGLRVRPHIRGHIASCNGRVEKLDAKVEPDPVDSSLSAVERAVLVQEWCDKEVQRKAERLAQFQKDVKTRVSSREKAKQKEIAATSRRAMKYEQKAAERAVKWDDDKNYVAVGLDVEDVKVLSGWKETSSSHFPRYQDSLLGSPLQIARKALLSESLNHPDTQEKTRLSTSVSEKSRTKCYKDAQQLSPSSAKTRQQSAMDKIYKSAAKQVGSEDDNIEAPSTASNLLKFTAPGQVEHMERVCAGKQYLVFRRLYSEVERDQVRKKKKQKAHSRQVEALKRKKEEERRLMESEIDSESASSIVSTSISDDKLAAEEWAELIHQEERRRQIQKAKEFDRYTTALMLKVREEIELKKLDVPPLCSCGETLWDTNPQTCANNCVFYNNPRAYAKALSNILQSTLHS